MSEIAQVEYDKARTHQLDRNDARRIRTRVTAAQENPARARVRWPFELIQNAQDAGPRDGASFVDIAFLQQSDNLVASHNGHPFVAQELAALLSGGSSKEFDDEETTGRFGTGFLVTHAISTRTDVEGVLKTEVGPEGFCIKLDRAGDEEAIAENIQEANVALANARPLSTSEIADIPTASFTYYAADPDVLEKGLDRLNLVVPYLYATCDKLGQIQVQRPHKSAFFQLESNPGQGTEEIDGFLLQRTKITVSQGETPLQYTAFCIAGKDATSGLLVVLEHGDERRSRVCLPGEDFPRIFVKFPIAGTHFLPFNVVLDGRFTPQQERDGIALNPSDKALIQRALSALPTLVRYALEWDWENAVELAHISIPKQMLTGEASSGEREWWQELIPEIARATAAQPVIATKSGLLPALDGAGEHASFLVSAVDVTGQTLVDTDSIRGLADRVTGLHLPGKEIAQNWGNIAREWDGLGLSVERLGLKELTDWVKERGKSVSDLPINGDRFRWLADLLLLAAELPEGIDSRPRLDGLVPDQHFQLRWLQDLRIDAGIPEVVKDIADTVRIDLRAELVHSDLMQALDAPGYEPAKDLIQKLLQTSTETQAVDRVLEELDDKLPDDRAFSEMMDLPFLRASASLATYLSGEDDNTLRLRRCPLLAGNDTIVRLRVNARILAPVSYWPESSRDYAELYTKNRALSDSYVADAQLNVALQPLIDRSIAIPAPLHQARRDELEGDLLREMAPGANTDSVIVRNQPFSQIAFLATEVVQRCGRNKDLATLLLDFVLNVAVKEDLTWDETNLINGNRSGDAVQLALRRSTWPYELKVRSWVPVPVGDEEEAEQKTFAPTPATEANLRDLLKPLWLRNNSRAIDLLHRVFGFNQLTLSLETLAPELKSEVESNLVKLLEDPDLVKSAAANLDAVRVAVENPEAAQLLLEAGAEKIQEIWADLDVKKRQAEVRTRNNNFGHAVQAAVKEAVESLGLNLKLVDSGFDYEVFPDNSSFSFEVGSYFLEVKSTVSRDVRLTPKQAKTACDHPDRFILCVVDLEDFPDAHAKENWQAVDVIPHAKIVTDIGGDFEKIYEGVTEFADAGNPVRLRNEEQLRYAVSPAIWEKGDFHSGVG